MALKEGNGKSAIEIDAETAAGIVFIKKLLALPRCAVRFAADGEDGKSKMNGFHTITQKGMLNALRLIMGFEDMVEPGSTAGKAIEILKRNNNGFATVQTIFSDGGLDGSVKPGTLTEKLNELARYGLVARAKAKGKNTYHLPDSTRNLAEIVDAILSSEVGMLIMAMDTAAELHRLSSTEELSFEPKK